MTNRELVSNYEGLYSLRKSLNKTLSANILYAIIHNLRIMEPFYKDYYQTYDAVIMKYCDPNPNQPDHYLPRTDQDESKLRAELEALDSISVVLNVRKVTLPQLSKAELSLDDMDALYFMLDES